MSPTVVRTALQATFVALLFLPPISPAFAQTLTVTPLDTFSSESVTIAPSVIQSVLKTSSGDYLVSHLAGEPAVVRYRGSRAVVVIDAVGDGPGEFRRGPRLFPGPSEAVIAASGPSIAFFRGDDLTLQRDFTARVRIDENFIALKDGRFVVDQELQGPDSLFTVLELSETGDVNRPLERRPIEQASIATVLAPSADGGFLTLSSNGSLIRSYTMEGRLERSIRLRDGWFEEWALPITGEGLIEPPRNRRTALRDWGGRYLVLSWVRDPDWRPAPTNERGMIQMNELELNRIYDTVFEVFDGSSGRSLAREQVDEAWSPVRGTRDEFFSTEADALGHVRTSVVAIQATE